MTKQARPSLTWDRLPLFATDEEIGEAALGRERRGEFAGLAASQERLGMPPIDPVWGGRYVPAVKAFWDHEYRINSATVPLAPNGVEGSFHNGKTKGRAANARAEVAPPKGGSPGPILVR